MLLPYSPPTLCQTILSQKTHLAPTVNVLLSCRCSLEMKPLVDLTSRALARMIEGKTPEEIRATFKLPDDLTEEEKLEPLKSGLADARIKLLNKLYAKKRQVGATLSCDSAAGATPAPCDSSPEDSCGLV
jgi:Skp1 family, dimerisation domain